MIISRKALLGMLKEYCYGKECIIYTIHERNRIRLMVRGIIVDIHGLSCEGSVCLVCWDAHFKDNHLELTLSEFEDFLQHADRLTRFCFDSTRTHNVFKCTEEIALMVRNILLDNTFDNFTFPQWKVSFTTERIISHIRHVVTLTSTKDQVTNGNTFVVTSEAVPGLPGVVCPMITHFETQEKFSLHNNENIGPIEIELREWLFKFIQ